MATWHGGTRRVWRSALFAAAGLAVVTVASAAAADVLGVIAARHAHFKEIGKAAKAMSEQLKSPTPEIPVVQAAVKQIDALAPQLPSWFPAGSGPAPGVKTEAKADIWTKPDEFKRDAAAFAEAAHKLDVVAAGGDVSAIEFKRDAAAFAEAAHKLDVIAAGGDVSAIRAQAQAMGQTCKTCHEAFRQRDD